MNCERCTHTSFTIHCPNLRNRKKKKGKMEETPLEACQENIPLNSITLHPFQLSSIEDFMVWVADDLLACFFSLEIYTRKEDIMDSLQNTVLPHPWFRAICIGDHPIGAISIILGSTHVSNRYRGELRYVLGSKFWGRGIATMLMDVDNFGSQRVLERAGLLREGLLKKYFFQKKRTREVVIHSFLSTDPIPKLQKKG